MRVTQFTMYNNFLINHQRDLSELQKIQTQIATGRKIDNMYDNPTIFTEYLKLNEEINSFTQVKKSANFALTFARQSDTVLNDVVTTLDTFKVNLLKAANDTNNETSRQAIVSELKGELAHLKDLANTSIDGKYIFSGSAFDKPPINDELKYQGNDKYVKAFLGAGVEREYNIPGSELFLGRDNDYKKHVTLNIPQYDKMKQHPEFVVRGADGKLYIDKTDPDPDAPGAVPVDEPITGESQIRMLTGVEDIEEGNGKYKDGTSYFYVKGKNLDGDYIDEKFSLSNSAKVSELLEKIGQIYGNTETNKVVDVTLNDMGEIQIKDLKSGRLVTDFYMVASDKDEASINDLVKKGAYIAEFQRSDFNSVKINSSITASNAYFDNKIFEFGALFRLDDNSRNALPSDKVRDVLGKGILASTNALKDISNIHLSGKDTDGNDVNVDVSINDTTTMQQLMDDIKSAYGDVTVSLENGEIKIIDNTIEKTEKSNLQIKLETQDDAGHPLVAFRSKDVANFDKLFFEKSGNSLFSNVSQIENEYKIVNSNVSSPKVANENAFNYATDNTTVANVDDAAKINSTKTFDLQFKDKDGNFKLAKIVLSDVADTNGYYSKIIVYDDNGNKTEYPIYNSEGEYTKYHDEETVTHELDPQTCELCEKTKYVKGTTFKQLGDAVSMLVSGNLPDDTSFESYKNAVEKARGEVDAGLDDKGRFYVKDKTNEVTKAQFSLTDETGGIYFQANNSITIDSPQVDFFATLQEAIEAVENGKNFADGYSNKPRNFGIQGAIEAIEHVMDRVRRSHAKIGAVSNEFDMSIQRVDMLKINVQTLQSDNIDTDIGEASMKLTSLKTSYEALLASIAKVNNLTLLNYLR
ncbi:MAG: flagellar hook-associated protein FlgL [Nautiliaceae bacterium]